MILKLIILLIAAGFVFRLFGGKIPFIDRKYNIKKDRDKDEVEKDFGGKVQATSQCGSCGVYITEDDALIYKRKAYCSTECVEKSKK